MKFLLSILSTVCLVAFKPPGETDYKKIFGERYTRAVNWLKHNDPLIEEYATAFNIPSKELKAIVFPELIRYNSFFNAIEIESLKYLYVHEGSEYADFSVGYFQMKPSFAEMIENDSRLLFAERYQQSFEWNTISEDEEELRRARVKRLSNVRHQLIYLCTFYKICANRFKTKNFTSPVERVKLFATCYNAGYKRSYASLLSFLDKKDFYGCNYSSISAFYYHQE